MMASDEGERNTNKHSIFCIHQKSTTNSMVRMLICVGSLIMVHQINHVTCNLSILTNVRIVQSFLIGLLDGNYTRMQIEREQQH